jgi:tetratricopeptide (TPR) repeat protein
MKACPRCQSEMDNDESQCPQCGFGPKAEAKEPKKSFDLFCNRGAEHAQKGEYDEAIADYTEAIRLIPAAMTYHHRAMAYFQKGLVAQANADATEAIRLDPQYFPAYMGRAVFFNQQGDLDRAIADNSEAIRLEPNYTVLYRNRGREYAQKGEHERAVADFTQAIRLEPQSVSAYMDRALCYRALGENHKAAADERMAKELGSSKTLGQELSLGRVAAVLALVLFWLPLVGLFVSAVAFWANRRTGGWRYWISLISLAASALVHALLIGAYVKAAMGW